MNKYILDCGNIAEDKIFGIKSYLPKDIVETVLRDIGNDYILSKKEDCEVNITDCIIGGSLYFSDIIYTFSHNKETRPSFVLYTLEEFFEELF